MSKREAGVDHKASPDYELAGRWQINLKGWSLVALAAGGTIIFGVSFILGQTIRGLLRGYLEGQVSLGGFFFLIALGVFVAFIILHEAVHGWLAVSVVPSRFLIAAPVNLHSVC